MGSKVVGPHHIWGKPTGDTSAKLAKCAKPIDLGWAVRMAEGKAPGRTCGLEDQDMGW